MRLLRWRFPALAGGGHERMFEPHIAVQRHAFVAAALRRAGARTFVDLGCGDGRLLEHLVAQARAASAACELVLCAMREVHPGISAAALRVMQPARVTTDAHGSAL